MNGHFHTPTRGLPLRTQKRASFIRALARGECEIRGSVSWRPNRIARLRFGRVQADGRRMCVLKVLLEKRREMRELVSGMVCAASEQSNVL